jgi:hypothetical protein
VTSSAEPDTATAAGEGRDEGAYGEKEARRRFEAAAIRGSRGVRQTPAERPSWPAPAKGRPKRPVKPSSWGTAARASAPAQAGTVPSAP